MAGINKVILLGNLGKDPDIRHLEGGASVANFPLATTEFYKDKNGNKVEQTEWHNIVLWRAQAEFAGKYLKKGNMILIEGKLRTRSWEDKDKVKRYTTEVVGDNVTIVNNSHNVRKEENTQANQTASGHSETTATAASHAETVAGGNSGSDDLPF